MKSIVPHFAAAMIFGLAQSQQAQPQVTCPGPDSKTHNGIQMIPIPRSASCEIIAHRGFSSQAPENTLSAFRLAWERGADACETDLHLTKDGNIVVTHDENLKRVSGEDKSVAHSALKELLTLDVGSWMGPKWKGEKIPTLDQALATMPVGKKRFFLEIKPELRSWR